MTVYGFRHSFATLMSENGMDKEVLIGADGSVYHKDDVISLDGGKGIVMQGAVKLVEARIDDNWNKFFTWVNEIKDRDQCIVWSRRNDGYDPGIPEGVSGGAGVCDGKQLKPDRR